MNRRPASLALAAALALSAPLLRAADPLPPQPNIESYAQHLVVATAKAHPELNILGLHLKPPGAEESMIIATSVPAKIGKKSDPDDIEVMDTNKPDIEAKDSRNLFDVGLPLLDASGTVIGTAVMEVKYSFTKDKDAALKRAIAIRDELSRKIQSKEQLLTVAKPDPKDLYAERLIAKTAALHPELNILSIHVAAPDGVTKIIATSNRSKIGKKSDPDDIEIMDTKKPTAKSMQDKQVVDLGLPLLDASGNLIGVTVMEVKMQYIKDEAAALQHGTKIRDELASQIQSKDQLFSK